MLKLKAKLKQDKNNDRLRESGRLPAVVYGHGVENKSIDLDYQEVRKALEKAGESTLIELDIDKDELLTVLIHDVQYNTLTDTISHLDFYQIKKGEKIDLDIELNFIGEAPAVKELAGVLVKPHDKIEVRCLPKDLVSHIDVDLSSLKTFDDSISVSDLDIPETLEVLESDVVVASVTPPRKEEEPEIPAEGELELPEIEGEKKEEGEEGGEEKSEDKPEK